MDVYWSPEVSSKLPQLAVCVGVIDGVTARKENEELHSLKKIVCTEMRSKYSIEVLKDNPIVRAYRDFYWSLGIDPTKTRPAGEALVRRVLHGDELPSVSNVVDAYNMASARTMIPVSGFDRDRIFPPLRVRFAQNDEVFTGIGMKSAMSLAAKVLVLADRKQVLCMYPYRDSDQTKVTMKTRNVAVVGYGAPGISQKQLTDTVETALSLIKQCSGGKIVTTEVFQSSSA